MEAALSIRNADVTGRTVLARADSNVPMATGQATDTTRINRIVATITLLLELGAHVTICSHLGRPEGGEANPHLSLESATIALADSIARPVRSATECVGQAAERAVSSPGPSAVVLIENFQFHAGEEDNHTGVACGLAIGVLLEWLEGKTPRAVEVLNLSNKTLEEI